MSFPKKYLINLKTMKKIFTCPRCKRPFSADKRWKRRVKTGGHVLLCKNPGCHAKDKTQPPRKRKYYLPSEVSQIELSEKETNDKSLDNDKMAINALLNPQTEKDPLQAETEEPAEEIHASNEASSAVTSRHALPVSQTPIYVDVVTTQLTQLTQSSLPLEEELNNQPNVDNITRDQAPVATVPSGEGIVPAASMNAFIRDIDIDMPLQLFSENSLVSLPEDEFDVFGDLDLDLDLEDDSLDLQADHDMVPDIPVEDPNSPGYGMDLDDLLCSEDELEDEIVSEITHAAPLNDDGMHGLLGHIMSMDSILGTLDNLDPEGFVSTTGLTPTSAVHDPMEGNTIDAIGDDHGSRQTFNPCPPNFWEYDV